MKYVCTKFLPAFCRRTQKPMATLKPIKTSNGSSAERFPSFVMADLSFSILIIEAHVHKYGRR